MTIPRPALGIRLSFRTTEEGGRATPVLGGSSPETRLKYRPNWGLPGWHDGEQTAAPVLGFNTRDIRPGDTTEAVIIPLFPDEAPDWSKIRPGDVLRMYEGLRMCAVASVLWIDQTEWAVSDIEAERLLKRLTDSA